MHRYDALNMDMYRTLFEHSRLGVFLFTHDGVITECNARFAMIVGASQEKLIGLNMLKDLPDKRVHEAIQKVFIGEYGTLYGEYTSTTGGRKSFLHTLFFGIKDRQKNVLKGIAIVDDLTDLYETKKQLLTTHTLIENIMRNLPDMVWAKDLEGQFIASNKRVEALLGKSEAEVIGKSDYAFFPHELATQCRLYDQKVMAEAQTVRNEEWLTFADGHKELCETLKSPMVDEKGEIVGVIGIARDITQRRALEERIRLMQHCIDQATLGIFWVNEQGCIVYANQSACHSLGYASEEIIQLMITDIDPIISPKAWAERWEKLKITKVSHFESLHRKKMGEVFPVEIYTNYIKEEGIEIAVGFVEDISKRKASKIALEQSEKLLKESQAIAKIGSWELDLSSNALVWSDEVYRIFGVDQHKFPASYEAFLNVIHPDDREMVNTAFITSLKEKTPYDLVHKLLVNGDVKYVHERCKTEYTHDGRPLRSVGTVHDVTDEYELASKIDYLVNHDSLTTLPNRFLITQRLEQLLHQYKRDAKKHVAVCFIDLDNFKYVNDAYDHSVGDEILKEVALRLLDKYSERGILARFGGDEFILVLDTFSEASDVVIIANEIVEILRHPFSVFDQMHQVSASVGISLYPEDASNANDLIKFADAAMHRAKESGKNHYQFYTNTLTEQMMQKIKIINHLREAIETEQFELYYQPQINLQTHSIVGFEALVRWHHPELGFVSPAQFIPVAEESKLIILLGEWILKKACMQMVTWKEENLFHGRMAVNVSGVQLDDSNFQTMVQTILEQTRLNAANLELELTESSLMSNPEKWIEDLDALDALGIRLAIDDFGTGYSSLSYLRQMPVDVLKIDQSFVRDLPSDSDACVIAEAIIGLSRSMKMESLAEGIEDEKQLIFLKAIGCQTGQGYYFSKPLPADKAKVFLQTWKKSQ